MTGRNPLPNLALLLVTGLALSACNNSGSGDAPPRTSVTAAAPDPIATAATTSFDVLPCFFQVVPGTGGTTVAGLVIPDVLTLRFGSPAGFPNGRRLEDPVPDITLAAIFLDLTRHSPGVLAGLPLNPPANDRPFRPDFPYLALPQGTPPIADATGTSFAFRTDPVSAYVRVDRMGMPAVPTVLIEQSRRPAYNDANPSDDARGDFVGELAEELRILTNALADDFLARGLTPCAKPD
jgi:hypothetical protein